MAKKSGKLPLGASTDIDPSSPIAIADFYAARFLEDARHLGLKVAIEAAVIHSSGDNPYTPTPLPTRCVPQMAAMIEQLVSGGHAYVA